MAKARYKSDHPESQPNFIEREMREILGIERELGHEPQRKKRR